VPPKAPVPLCYLLLGDDEAVAREDGLLQVLMEDGQPQAPLIGHHTHMVHLTMCVVEKDLRVGEVAAKRSRKRGLY
jgi:hypothetical protein